jgi:crotonobetainyl-CoA:carnitine CoA-transferase CaiB-like acyl-CoA transferase
MVAILDGTRVLDFTQALSGPTATRYLAELGAEVTKVEVPPAGDTTRATATVRDGRSGYFATVNRGKRSICVDIKDNRGLALVRNLAAEADVVIENFSPGTMDRLGLGWEELSARNPRLVMCSISGFGQRGPLAHLPGYDGAAQAYAGFTSLNGEAGGEPIAIGAPIGDVFTGVNATAAILAALLWRDRTGQGQRVETSLLECYLQTHDTALESWSVSGGEVVQRPHGRFHQLACPYGVFRACDGYIFIAAAADRHWVDLCRAMAEETGDDTLLDPDHPWNDRRRRETDRHEVSAHVERWLQGLASRDDGLALLQRHRVPCGPVLGIDEVAEHPDLRATGMIRLADDPVLGQLHVPGFPLHFSATEAGFDTEAPHLGEHNVEVLTRPAGGPEALAQLVDEGVIQAPVTTARPSRQR